jgi:ubiquinone/menaquinone biosynthesis C-methylase UbiE
MSIDPYKNFADRYDLFFTRFGEHDRDETEFYRNLFTDHKVHKVLDCACGTGHDLVLFNALGCEVNGSDVSEAMLTRASKNLKNRGLNIPLKKADYRELSLHYRNRFDAVVCLSSSICHMRNGAELLKAFGSMHKVLRSDGLLILTQGTTDKQWNEKPRFILPINNEKFSRVFVIDYVGKGARYNVLDLFHTGDQNELKVWSIDYQWMILSEDYYTYLRKSGFRRISLYGTYLLDPYDQEMSDILIVVAQK